jgi:hypothetical protein|tara:strand:+ start:588 stop:1265 length:678 start_codon:yes stop_codon:yes gene_type:complete
MKAWFDDPQQLIKSDEVFQFWPNNEQTPEDRINSSSRFIIYASCIIYLTRRDPRIFVLGGTIIGVLYVMYKSKMVKEGYGFSVSGDGRGCQMPTVDNPMGNVLMTDYTDAPNRLEACYYPTVKSSVKAHLDDRIPYDAGRSRSPLPSQQRNAYARQFVTTAVSQIPGDQTSFAEWCYGSKNKRDCRTNPEMCSPNARGVQLEAFGGLDISGDSRVSHRGHGIGPS